MARKPKAANVPAKQEPKEGLSEDGRTFIAPNKREGKLKMVGGSTSDTFNAVLLNQTWMTHRNIYEDDPEYADKIRTAVLVGMEAIKPQDELEGMVGAQLVASHAAAMECYRRAMIANQTFEGRRENLTQANKLSRTYVTLLEALNRHRGKGQQKVTVEHVHVYEGGQAVVGHVDAGAIAVGRGR